MERNVLIGLIGTFAIIGIIGGVLIFGGFLEGQDTETLAIQGSTTVFPLADAWAEAYMDDHDDVDIQVTGTGSSTGIKACGEGTVDMGMASRDLKDSEKTTYPNLQWHLVAKDGLSIIVHPSNSIDALTVAQVQAIYNGTYTNWNQLGGADSAIIAVGRDSASGTRGFFDEFVLDDQDPIASMHEHNSNGGIVSEVSTTPAAIGYVGLAFIDSSIKALNLDTGSGTVEPTIANVIAGTYPLARPLLLLTLEDPDGLAKDFLEYALSTEGQAVVLEVGYVPV